MLLSWGDFCIMQILCSYVELIFLSVQHNADYVTATIYLVVFYIIRRMFSI